jgi:Homeobox KN domain
MLTLLPSHSHTTRVLNKFPIMDDSDDDDTAKGRSKSRRELPAGAVATLKAWLVSPEHFTHPYPTPQDQVMLMQKTGIDKKQLKNWFTNARRRIWKPMLKKQLEHGKVSSAGVGGAVAMPGVAPSVLPGVAPGIDPQQAHYRHPGQVQHQELQQQVRFSLKGLFLQCKNSDAHSFRCSFFYPRWWTSMVIPFMLNRQRPLHLSTMIKGFLLHPQCRLQALWVLWGPWLSPDLLLK